MYKIVNAKAICKIFGDGQKTIAALLELGTDVKGDEIVQEDFEVSERTVTGVYVSASGRAGEPADQGRFIIIELSADDRNASTKYRIGKGRDARMGIRRPVLEIRYIPENEKVETEEVVDELADQFRLFRYQAPCSGQYLDYQLYVPERLESQKKYPLVLFMHDMGACSDDTAAPLAQGLGAVVWTEKERQEKYPCFVLAPCYPRKTANDEYQVTWEADATVGLIREICDTYAIDTGRIYGTGQSMGCMMLCELNLKYPDVFAGSFMVAGQWDPQRMGAVKDQSLWILVSEKDEKAFPIMGECMERVEKNGGTVVRGHFSARDPLEVQNEKIRRLMEENGRDSHIFFTWYEGDSVLLDGAEVFPGAYHMSTWVHAYMPEAIQEWLFGCVK